MSISLWFGQTTWSRPSTPPLPCQLRANSGVSHDERPKPRACCPRGCHTMREVGTTRPGRRDRAVQLLTEGKRGGELMTTGDTSSGTAEPRLPGWLRQADGVLVG